MDLRRLTELAKAELKKRINSIVQYKGTSVSLEQVFGLEHEKVRLGQSQRLKDEQFNPPLYLEARVHELKKNLITNTVENFLLGDFVEYNKDDLIKRVKNLNTIIQDKISKLILLTITSSAGDVFKNGQGSTVLTARPFIGGSEIDIDGTIYSYQWSKRDELGNLVDGFSSSEKTITVNSADFVEKATYIVEIIISDNVSQTAEFTITNVNDGEDAWHVEIISSNGNIFKSGQIDTVLSARVYRGTEDITHEIPVSKFRWTRVSSDTVADQNWNNMYYGGTKDVVVTTRDVYQRATFFCDILE